MEGKYDVEHASLRLERENTLIDDKNEPFNLKGVLVIEFSSPKEPKCDNSWVRDKDGGNKDHKYNFLSFGPFFDNYIILSRHSFHMCLCVQ